VIERTYGLLIGVKAAVNPTLPEVVKTINDGLMAIVR
jgi:hypothetical protein